MQNLLKSTYTYGMLKDNILKVMGEFTQNGSAVSGASGFLADAEKKLVSVLNMCLRRVSLSLPLLKKTEEMRFVSGKAVLPEECANVVSVTVSGKDCVTGYSVCENEIFCSEAGDGGYADVTYTVIPAPFSSDMPSGTSVNLPDITCDALCYLTAAELCPAEYAELYGKLMYKYRDICLNIYNCEKDNGMRNSFFKKGSKRDFRFI